MYCLLGAQMGSIHEKMPKNLVTLPVFNPNSSGIFSGRLTVAWCAKKHTIECALKHNAKTDIKFFRLIFF